MACSLLRTNTMKLTVERLGRWLPVPVLSLDRMPGRLIGLSLGVFVVVRSDYAGDRPTIVHELEHCRQFWTGGLVVHMVRYYASQTYRLRTELEAFQAELRACPAHQFEQRLHESVRVLASCYEIGHDEHSCRQMLTSGLMIDDVAYGTPTTLPEHIAPLSIETRLSPLAARSADPSSEA